MEKIKKLVIKLAVRWMRDGDAAVTKLDNGYVFGNRFYPDLDSMADDLVGEIKKFFEK